ncbi:MAG: GAF domain-containing protein [Anaerolineae bacterium]|nr:GAF domain-containing protein [Anaerolineae bacterium]
MSENTRLLEATCQAAMSLVPSDLAWLLTAEDARLRSRAIVTEKGQSAAQVFIRLLSGGSPEHPAFPLVQGDNPLVDALLNVQPRVNVPAEHIRKLKGGEPLGRALSQLRLEYVHFLPLPNGTSTPSGLLVLAGKREQDTASLQNKQALGALITQAATVIDNARLTASLASREEQMRAEQAFRKMVLDTMAESLIVIDEDAVIRYVNNRLLNLTGYTRSELLGFSIGNIFHPDGREPLVRNLKRGGRGTLSFSQKIVTKSGRLVPVLMSRAAAPSVEFKGQSTVLVLSDLSEQTQREHALEQQGERLRALNRAVQAIASASTRDQVTSTLLQSAISIVRGVSVCLFLANRSLEGVLKVVAAQGPQASTLMKATARTNEGLLASVIRARRAQILLSIETSQPFAREGDDVLAVPMFSGDEIVGVLVVINKAEGLFGQDDVETLENLAAAASVAIEKTRLFEQMQRRVGELSTLLEASATVSTTLDIRSVLELITRDLRETLRVARCAVGEWDKKGEQLVILAEACNAYWTPGQGPERALASMLFSTGMLRASRVLAARYNDPGLNPRVRAQFDVMGMASLLLAPVRFSQTVAGVVELYTAQGQPPFNALHLQAVGDLLPDWDEQNAAATADRWRGYDNLTELATKLMQASNANWCVISVWDRLDRKARALREIGFAAWAEENGSAYRLADYPTMAGSLTHGLPMTLYPALLHDDANERAIMTRCGTPTGLVTPFAVRGEAFGLVKLLDVDPDRAFDLAEISLCQGIANVVGSALENAQLYRSLERRAAALETAYKALQEADRLKDNLIQSLSHELKTPLHKMSMQLDLLSQEALGPITEEQRAAMQSLVRWNSQLGALINDMVSLHAIESQELQSVPVRLDSVIKGAAERIRARAGQARHRIDVALPPDLPAVRGDLVRLGELLDQLLDNAVKFSPDADHVDVRATVDDAAVQVCVQDYGIGIAADEQERIFTQGYQVDSSMTRRFSGTGLGLALCRRIVEKHQGRIWVESTPGQGSKFYFSLPRTEASEPSTDPKPVPTKTGPLSTTPAAK